MGSATSQALTTAREALAKQGGKDGLTVGTQLFAAAHVIGGSPALRSALADPSADPKAKTAVIAKVFSATGAAARDLLSGLVAARWSTHDDLLAGIEEIGIRAVAGSAPKGTSIESELFAFGDAVSSDAELELAVGSKLGSAEAKSALVTALLTKKASAQTLAIVDHLVQQPRGRRIGGLLRGAASIVADQAGLTIATVTTAAPLSAAQAKRLGDALSKNYGRELQLHLRVDPALIGGVRVQVGDDVIDGSVATRITDLRLQLAS